VAEGLHHGQGGLGTQAAVANWLRGPGGVDEDNKQNRMKRAAVG